MTPAALLEIFKVCIKAASLLTQRLTPLTRVNAVTRLFLPCIQYHCVGDD